MRLSSECSNSHVSPSATPAKLPDVPVGLGMFRSKLGLGTPDYARLDRRHYARVSKSDLGRMHVESINNGGK